jgi:hypothetical protein
MAQIHTDPVFIKPAHTLSDRLRQVDGSAITAYKKNNSSTQCRITYDATEKVIGSYNLNINTQ